MFFRVIKGILGIDFFHERHTVNAAYYSLTLDKTKFVYWQKKRTFLSEFCHNNSLDPIKQHLLKET